MVACTSVLARMAVRRRIAAEGAPARLAGAQMNPAITGLHACFAFVTAWCLDATDRVDMSACFAHNATSNCLRRHSATVRGAGKGAVSCRDPRRRQNVECDQVYKTVEKGH